MKFLPTIRTVNAPLRNLYRLCRTATGLGLALAIAVLPADLSAQRYYYPQGYYQQQQPRQQRQYRQQPRYPQYPQQPQYPGYPQQYPQYPQYPQQPQATPGQDTQRSAPGAQPRKSRSHKDISGDTPPGVDVSALTSGPFVTYTWDARDTLGDLAKAAGISNSQILALNNLSVSQLRSGQVLRLPQLATTTPSLDIKRNPADQHAREIWRGVRGKKRVALTFDAGGVTAGLDTLLKNLTEKKAPATFFATGKFAKDYPKSVKSIVDAGYRIHNHSWSHPEFTSLTEQEMRDELSRTDDILTSETGHSTKPFWRPPFGDRDSRVLQIAGDAGYISIYWTHDSLDSVGDTKDAAFVADRVLNPPKSKANPDGFLDGAIVLMHVGEEGTANALPQIIDGLRERGFTLVTVEEILQP